MDATTYCASDPCSWSEAGLKDFGDYAECVEYGGQRESGYGDLEGDWFYGDDDHLVIYYGTHGNDHSPGASHYTHATRYDHREDYAADLAHWEAQPEYLEDDTDFDGIDDEDSD